MTEAQKINASDLLVNAKILYFQSTNEFCILLADPRKTKRKNTLRNDYYTKLCNINTIFSTELIEKNIKNKASLFGKSFQSLSYVIPSTSFITFVDVSENLLFNDSLLIKDSDSLGAYLRALIHEIKEKKDEGYPSLINDTIEQIFANDLKGSYKTHYKEVFKSLSAMNAGVKLAYASMPNKPWGSAPKDYFFQLQSDDLKPSIEFLQNFSLQKNNFGAYSIDPLCFFHEFFPEVCKAIDFGQYMTIENHQNNLKKSNGIYKKEGVELVQKNIEQQLLDNKIYEGIKGDMEYEEEFYDADDGSSGQTIFIKENVGKNLEPQPPINQTTHDNQNQQDIPKQTTHGDQTAEKASKPITSENQTEKGDQETPKSKQKENIKQHCFLIQWIIDFFKKIAECFAECFKHDKKNFEHQNSNRVAENTIEV